MHLPPFQRSFRVCYETFLWIHLYLFWRQTESPHASKLHAFYEETGRNFNNTEHHHLLLFFYLRSHIGVMTKSYRWLVQVCRMSWLKHQYVLTGTYVCSWPKHCIFEAEGPYVRSRKPTGSFWFIRHLEWRFKHTLYVRLEVAISK